MAAVMMVVIYFVSPHQTCLIIDGNVPCLIQCHIDRKYLAKDDPVETGTKSQSAFNINIE